jgi:hypothetical protein
VNVADLLATPEPYTQREEEGHAEVGGCDPPRLVRLRSPAVLWLLPSTPARICRFRFEDGTVLAIVQYQSGPMQRARWTDTVMCAALLAELFEANPKSRAAGCVGAHWNEVERLDVNLVLFEVTKQGGLALLR